MADASASAFLFWGRRIMAIELNRACAHLKTTGFTCGAYALRNSDLCYWHHKARQSRQKRRKTIQQQDAPATGLVLPLLEDANSIQLAIQMIAQAAADRRITRAESGSLLYSCQLAIMNLKNLTPVRSVYTSRVLNVRFDGSDEEDIVEAVEIPKDCDPEFANEDEEEDDDNEIDDDVDDEEDSDHQEADDTDDDQEDEDKVDDEDADRDEIDEEGLEEAVQFIMKNLAKAKRLVPSNEVLQSMPNNPSS
jgi:TATA-binding protein-associated factor Taf7